MECYGQFPEHVNTLGSCTAQITVIFRVKLGLGIGLWLGLG